MCKTAKKASRLRRLSVRSATRLGNRARLQTIASLSGASCVCACRALLAAAEDRQRNDGLTTSMDAVVTNSFASQGVAVKWADPDSCVIVHDMQEVFLEGRVLSLFP